MLVSKFSLFKSLFCLTLPEKLLRFLSKICDVLCIRTSFSLPSVCVCVSKKKKYIIVSYYLREYNV